jgi:uncharacterized protein with PIN domain
VVEHFHLDRERALFQRCTECNTPVEEVAGETVADRVPARLAGQVRFTRCPGCGRVYWEGSHTRRMRRALEQALRR